jgi:hypothetical protein
MIAGIEYASISEDRAAPRCGIAFQFSRRCRFPGQENFAPKPTAFAGASPARDCPDDDIIHQQKYEGTAPQGS